MAEDTGQQLLKVTNIQSFFQVGCVSQNFHPGAADVNDEDEEDDDKKTDSAEILLHEFVYKLKSYFLETERCLRVAWML